MYNFCTLFNYAYLSRGIALYESLEKYCDDFKLYIFAFDDICYEFLNKLNFKKAVIVSLKEFEDEELIKVKKTRTNAEYCWTCSSSIILYSISKYNLNMCTYLDADIYFYYSPKLIFDEMGQNSVLITEHRFTPEYDTTEKNGKYCVQFMTFKNNESGLKALNWWRNSCIKWCYDRVEDGKFGDQKYLDDWTDKFEGIHELKYLGGGVAPWNVQQYSFEKQEENVIGTQCSTGNEFKLIFYHFHSLKIYDNGIVDLAGYKIPENAKKIIYKKYLKHIIEINNKIRSIDNNSSFSNLKYNKSIKQRLIRLKRKLNGTDNFSKLKDFI